MKLLTILRAALLALPALASIPALAAQAPYAQPDTGPHSMADFVDNYLNPTTAAVLDCNAGTTAPSTTDQPAAYQCWLNTSTTPRKVEIYDGTSWVVRGLLDTSGLRPERKCRLLAYPLERRLTDRRQTCLLLSLGPSLLSHSNRLAHACRLGLLSCSLLPGKRRREGLLCLQLGLRSLVVETCCLERHELPEGEQD